LEAAQTHEVAIYNRDGGTPFTFLTIRSRSVTDGIQSPDAHGFAYDSGRAAPGRPAGRFGGDESLIAAELAEGTIWDGVVLPPQMP
jgi:hypothetical protein